MDGGITLEPFRLQKEDIDTFIANSSNRIIRKGCDMAGFFQEEVEPDRVIYEVYEIEAAHESKMGLTIMRPGRVGVEYHMTKGHFHEVASADEHYFCLSGKGIIIMQNQDGDIKHLPFEEGGGVYVPPGWAHRTVNVGDDDLLLLAIFPKDAGHDYGTIEEKGFKSIVVEVDGRPAVIENPKQ